jgi:hypothetical protein
LDGIGETRRQGSKAQALSGGAWYRCPSSTASIDRKVDGFEGKGQPEQEHA